MQKSENSCEFCGKKFSCPQNLRTHEKTAKYCLVARGEIIGNKCKFCDEIFSRKSSLQRHLKTCCDYKDHIIEELNEKLKEKDRRILELEKEIESKKDVGEGTMVSMKKNGGKVVAKKVINNKVVNKNIYVSQKLLMLPIDNIEPLTIGLVKTKAKDYTYEMYRRSILGVVDFIRDLTTLELDDGIIEKNYACTDRSRYAFHRLTNEKVWRKDGGAMFINRILDALSSQVKIHDKQLENEIKLLGGSNLGTEKLSREQTNLAPFYNGVVHNDGTERKVLFQKIRNKISDICSTISDSENDLFENTENGKMKSVNDL